jgi:hypothetical protein
MEKIIGADYILWVKGDKLYVDQNKFNTTGPEWFLLSDLEKLGLYYGQPKPLTYSDIEYSGGTGCTGLTGQKIIGGGK